MRIKPHTLPALVAVASALWLSGCYAGYQGAVENMHAAIDAGDIPTALAEANRALGVDEAHQMPRGTAEDTTLLLLERATLLQGLGRHEDAVRDFAEADKAMEILDLSQDDAGAVGEYLFSGDAGIYRAPPHEKLMVNTLAMISYMSLGDLEGARVEARRLGVLQKYFKDAAPEELALYGLGSYLAGFVFEQSGDTEEALRYYMEAYDNGYDELAEQVAYLGERVGSGHDLVSRARVEAPSAAAPTRDEGEMLVIVQSGRVPYKQAERLPVGAFVVAPVADARWQMSPAERRRADSLVAEGVLKWINFPVLQRSPLPFRRFSVSVGSSRPDPQIFMDLEECTIAAWEYDKDKLMFAAFTRMVARALAGNATEAVAKGSKLDKQLFPGASALLGAVVEGGLTAADTPDTRSWTLLPANIRVYRVKVDDGTHRIMARGSGGASSRQSYEIEVPSGRYGVANFRFFASDAF